MEHTCLKVMEAGVQKCWFWIWKKWKSTFRSGQRKKIEFSSRL